jgi:hypothetical protein
MSDKRPTNSELRIAKLTEEAQEANRPGVLIIFDRGKEAARDGDAPLTRDRAAE